MCKGACGEHLTAGRPCEVGEPTTNGSHFSVALVFEALLNFFFFFEDQPALLPAAT